MAKRKHLPVISAGKRYEGWMPFAKGEPLFQCLCFGFHNWPCSEAYASRSDAEAVAEHYGADVRHVTIIVTPTRRSKP